MNHNVYMQRCIQLAKNGLGTTYPNPMVGSVIVFENKIIGEGWHYQAGKPHAEVNAIQSVKDKNLLKKATIYVSLEPCSHFGKTPPCSDLIIKNEIPNVVIGTIDPFAKVAGRGIEKLKNAGCKVTVGVLEKECQQLNKRFFTFHNHKRPYIFLKWAQTNDGFISPEKTTEERTPIWISNNFSKQLVHKQRAQEQAILVGTQTVIEDNPTLNTRNWFGTNCTRVVIDLNNRILPESNVFDGSQPTIIFCNEDKPSSKNLVFVKINPKKCVPTQICNVLHSNNIQSLIVEGGTKTLQYFINAQLWDEAFVYSPPKTHFFEGTKAPKLPKNATVINFTTIKDNVLTQYKND